MRYLKRVCKRELAILIMASVFLFAAGSIIGLTAVKAGDTPISLYIVSPKNGATVAGDTTLVKVAYNCQLQPIVSLELYVDDRFYDIYQLLRPGMQGEYEFRWNTLSCSQGVHKLRINAYDAGGNVAVTEIKVNVGAGTAVPPPDSEKRSSSSEDIDEDSDRPGEDSSAAPATPAETEPMVKIIEPRADSRVTGMVEVVVSISDMDDFKYMIFYVDGKLKKISNVAPFRYEWNSDREMPGRHKLSVRAYTEAGTVITGDCQIWVRAEPPVAQADIKPAAETLTSNVNGPETNIPQVRGAEVSAAKPEAADAPKASIDVVNSAVNTDGDAKIAFSMTNNRISNPLLPGLKSPTIGAASAAVAQAPAAEARFKDAIRESYAARVDAKNLAVEMDYSSVSEVQPSAPSLPSRGMPQVTVPAATARKAAAPANVTGSAAKEAPGAEYAVRAGAESVAHELGVDRQAMAVATQQRVAPVVPQVAVPAATARKAAAPANVTGSAAKEAPGAEYAVRAGAESVAHELGVDRQAMAVATQQRVAPVVPQVAVPAATARKAAAPANVTGSAAKEAPGAEYAVRAGAESVAHELGVDRQAMAVASRQAVGSVIPQIGSSLANEISFADKSFADNAERTGAAPKLSVAVPAKTAAAEATADDASFGNVEAPFGNIPQVEPLGPSAIIAANVTVGSKKQVASGYSMTPEAESVTIQASSGALSAPVARQASLAKAMPPKEGTISRHVAEVVAAAKTVASNVLSIRGKVIQQRVAPYVDDGYTMAAAREPMNTLGAVFTWDKKNKSVLCDFGMKIRFTIGSNIVDVDGRRLVMPKAAKIVNGRLVVPIRFLSELTGVNINCK